MILHTVTIDLTRSGFFFFSRTSVITTLMLIPELNSGDCVFFFFFLEYPIILGSVVGTWQTFSVFLIIGHVFMQGISGLLLSLLL